MNALLDNFDFTHMQQMVVWLVLTYAIVFVAMAVDLVTGVRKAIQLGIATTSTGYKKTCSKANKYYSPMLRLTFIDLLASAFVGVPVFSMLWGAYCLWCEWKSVTEKALTKQELRAAENTMQVIIQNKADLAKVLVEALHTMNEEDKKKLLSNVNIGEEE